MKFATFGATGRTGQPLIEQALASGHEVVALVRTPSQLTLSHANLSVLQGDVLNQADVEQSVQGTQAVSWSLGTPKPLRAISLRLELITSLQR